MCRNQEIFPVSASLFLRYLLIANLLSLWDTLYMAARDLEPTRYTWKAEGSAILDKIQRARTAASLHSV
ncbi:MAG: hypothetical protein J6386_21080 [Candidatus Synoicihabitans palmerolidicus]|nr:hypothetical protein [Candidatus Synoicihabitans palmerolidicus]